MNGLSVSYDRVIQVSIDLANGAIKAYEEAGIVCPTVLQTGLFTTGQLDNVDHNPSATSAHTSFHGTAISISQHVTRENHGVPRHHGPVVGNLFINK